MLLFTLIALIPLASSQVPQQPGSTKCEDRLNNCNLYGPDSCTGTYKQWAEENCPLTCKFCQGAAKPCENKDTTCDLYDLATCDKPMYASWAENNCRYRCRRCTPAELAAKDALKTTLPPALCKDKLDCRNYGKSSCTGQFEHWAHVNCMEFCGFCQGPPTPPRACADTIPACATYTKSVCSDSKYTLWVQDNCAAYCGICKGASTGSPVVGTPNVGTPSVIGPNPVMTTSGPPMPTPPVPPGRK